MTEASITDAQQAEWQVSPARNRPKRLKVVKAKSAADRLKAATQKSSGDEGKYYATCPRRKWRRPYLICCWRKAWCAEAY
ncbi:hypothetical protein ACFSJQ_09275 [Vibrio olivae]